MPKRRHSNVRTTLLGALLTFVLAVGIPWGPGCLGCELDTSPIKPPVNKPSADDADSGEERVS